MEKTNVITKNDVVKAAAEKAGTSQKEAHKVINAMLDSIAEFIAGGKDVAILGFGTWRIKERGPRKVMNFKTKKMMEIPSRKTISFSVSKSIKNKLRANTENHQSAEKPKHKKGK